jgi:hypothetical protein
MAILQDIAMPDILHNCRLRQKLLASPAILRNLRGSWRLDIYAALKGQNKIAQGRAQGEARSVALGKKTKNKLKP